MTDVLAECNDRLVRVQTLHGAIDGRLGIGSRIRTLDELNLPSQKFLRIEAPVVSLPGCEFDRGAVGVNKGSILFVTELAGDGPTSDERIERSHFWRTAVRLRIGEFDVQGFLHVRGLRDPLAWLSQSRQSFVALTAASVVGPGTEVATPFIAVNPRHVLAAQALQTGDEPDGASASEEER